ncbi:MAG TPA: CDP-diacylglycerol--serine O-phosphatidyltransferase [Rhizomicrobium sp.]
MSRVSLGRTAHVLKEEFPFRRYIPSGLTLLGLCCGVTAIRFALGGDYRAAVIAIICAAVFDLLDGRVARLFGVASAFGAQLDSLADLVNFGIAPSMLVYLWTLHRAHGAGWALALAFCVCCAIRLARFNVESVNPDPEAGPEPYFRGVPTPAAACLILLPMLLGFQFSDQILSSPLISAGIIALVSALMVSRVPTLSLKNIHVLPQFRGLVIALGVLMVATAIVFPWSTLTGGLIIYLIALPFGAVAFSERRQARRRLRMD